MILGFLDTETTGLDQAKGHRLVEYAFVTYHWPSREKLQERVIRIDPDRAIDADAQAVHGIAYSDLVGKPKWESVAPHVLHDMETVTLLIAHNMEFDGTFIGGELLRIGSPLPKTPTFCTMENGRWACFNGKAPRLEELCFALGVEYDKGKAHAALYDVQVMAECYFKAVDRGFFPKPGEH